ncbi:MAG: hypothetical protein KJ056_04210 [Acidimicrobiia bacterium]|nr:hypothetical protein [Acidimicrobiia bacterium]
MTRAARTVLAALTLAGAVAFAIGPGPRAVAAPVAAPRSRPAPAPPPHPKAPKRLRVGSGSTLAGIPTNGALDDLRAALPDWEVTLDAHAYRNTAQGVDVAAARDPSRFDVVVVGLGANDAWSTDNFSAQMDRMLTLLTAVPRVYWLTLRESPRFQRAFAPVNSVIRLRAAAAPHVEVADWNRFGAEHPEAFYGDGLHLTPAGGADAARFIASLVERTNPYLEAEPTEPREEAPTDTASGPSPGAEITTPATARPTRPSSSPVRRPDADPSPWAVTVTIGAIVLAGAGGIVGSRLRRPAPAYAEPSGSEPVEPLRSTAAGGAVGAPERTEGSEPAIR